MKMICASIVCFGIFICASCTMNVLQSPRDDLYADFSGYPIVYVIFFCEQDGIPRALAAGMEEVSEERCLWNDYFWEDERWKKNKKRASEGNDDDVDSHILGNVADFCTVTTEGQNPKLIFIHDNRDRETRKDEGKMVINRIARRMTIDSEGYLNVIPIPELEIKDYLLSLSYTTEHPNGESYPWVRNWTPVGEIRPFECETYILRDNILQLYSDYDYYPSDLSSPRRAFGMVPGTVDSEGYSKAIQMLISTIVSSSTRLESVPIQMFNPKAPSTTE